MNCTFIRPGTDPATALAGIVVRTRSGERVIPVDPNGHCVVKLDGLDSRVEDLREGDRLLISGNPIVEITATRG